MSDYREQDGITNVPLYGARGYCLSFSLYAHLSSWHINPCHFRDLKLIKDSHPKYVISMDRLYLTELSHVV